MAGDGPATPLAVGREREGRKERN
jgi:hypothetical protein